MHIQVSEFADRVVSSEIRELLKYTRKSGIISFAGGLPDPSLFPLHDIHRISREVLEEKGFLALQYGPTPGEPEFIEAIMEHMGHFGEKVLPDQICVSSSSQQGLDLLSMIMLDKSSEVAMELPSYLGAIQAFQRNGARMHGIPLQHDGIDLGKLDDLLKKRNGKGNGIRFIYTIPDYQNPSGVTMSLGKRKELLRMAAEYGVPVIEDSPYRELCFDGEMLPSLWTLSGGEGVIQLKTLSKMLFPGMRLGWVVAPATWAARFQLMKQSVDLCSPSFNQLIISRYFREGLMKQTIRKATELYREKNRVMLGALEKNMPAWVKWSRPDGGMFLWIELPEGNSSRDMVPDAVNQNVIYVTGTPFHCNGSGQNTLRLNYSFPDTDQIRTGIERLAATIIKTCKTGSTIL